MMLPETKTRLRVVIVVTARITADTFVAGFARFIAREGHDVVVIADGIENSTIQVGAGSLTQIQVMMARNPSPFHDLKSLVSLFRVLRGLRPDVLTYATPKASLLSSVAGFLLRVPVRVYQLWGLRLETISGPGRILFAMLERLTSSLSTSVLANSRSLARRYSHLKLNVRRSVDVLGEGSSHGVDTEYFDKSVDHGALNKATENFLTERDGFVVGFVGRLHPDKGIDTLLDASRIVASSGLQITLILVGEYEGVELDLSGGLEGVTVVVGHVEDARPYYTVMDVLVLPSLREGFPNVVLEAAAMCVPAIVSDGTGVVDSVVDGYTGFVVPVADSRALAEAIRKLSNDGELKRSLGKAARLRATEHFDQLLVWSRNWTFLSSQAMNQSVRKSVKKSGL